MQRNRVNKKAEKPCIFLLFSTLVHFMVQKVCYTENAKGNYPLERKVPMTVPRQEKLPKVSSGMGAYSSFREIRQSPPNFLK